MPMFLLGALLLVLFLTALAEAAPGEKWKLDPLPAGEKLLATLRPGHPRLMATQADFDRLRQTVKTDPTLRGWHAKLLEQGEKLLTKPAVKYELRDGVRLLFVSRDTLEHVTLLALLYQLDGQPKWRDRAWLDLEAAAKFPDWHPKHFLDTAELCHAFAIGYDWLYHAWTPAQRKTIRTALVDLGLNVGLEGYVEDAWWSTSHHNWNQVCNGGLGIGALAVAEEEPKLAAELLHGCMENLPLALANYGPDGAWAEGPGYWGYATKYTVAFLAALDTALGRDFGLTNIPGLNLAADFHIQTIGPTRKLFNFADCGEGVPHEPGVFWLARRFNRPDYLAFAQAQADLKPHALDMVWHQASTKKNALQPSLAAFFRGPEAAVFRTAWGDPKALFAGIKGGSNNVNHSNLDIGSFVLDALGQRWFSDMGGDNYNLPAYFGKLRWTYYRLRAEGHNTLVLNPGQEPDQSPSARAGTLRFVGEGDSPRVVYDLTPAYQKHGAAQVRRGLALLPGREVLLRDEVTWAQGKKKEAKGKDTPAHTTEREIWWFAHTAAEIALAADKRTATLTLKEEKLVVRLLSPAQATFSVMDAVPLETSPQPEKQNANKGMRKLTIHVSGLGHADIVVRITPQWPEAKGEAASSPLMELPLEKW